MQGTVASSVSIVKTVSPKTYRLICESTARSAPVQILARQLGPLVKGRTHNKLHLKTMSTIICFTSYWQFHWVMISPSCMILNAFNEKVHPSL